MNNETDILEQNAVAPTKLTVQTLSERLFAMRNIGPRLPTGIEPLDKHLRGGLRLESFTVIGGAPSAGKTTLMLQIARGMARRGIAVGWVAADEAPSGLDIRNMQSIGLARGAAEEPDADATSMAVRLLGELPLIFYDTSLDSVVLEDVFVDLAMRYPGVPRVVMLDSLQTCKTSDTDKIDSRREQIDNLVRVCKRMARDPVTRAAVVTTSELARAAYRNKQSADNIEDMAAAKESGSIEYAAQTLLVLRNTSGGGSDKVMVAMPKNRTGTRGGFMLELNHDTATFTAKDLPVDGGDIDREAANAELMEKVYGVVSANPGATKNFIVQNVRGRAAAIYAAIETLALKKVIQEESGVRGAKKWQAIAPLDVPPGSNGKH